MDIGKTKTDIVAEQLLTCRKIVKEIDDFGINEVQRIKILYLLSLGLENIDALTAISNITKKYLGNPLETITTNKLEI